MAEFADLVRRHLLWLLLPTYLIAYLLPEPGEYAARLQITGALPEAAAVRAPMLLVAVLLFCAAVQVELAQVQSVLRQATALVASLFAVWLAPALVVALASVLFQVRGGDQGAGLLLGMILVAAMPVANSSAGWTQQSGGSLGWALALIVFSILLSPLVTPAVIRLMGMSLTSSEAAGVEHIVRQFSGVSFIVWVLAPTFLGMTLRWLLGSEVVKRAQPWLHLATAGSILGLNYLNGSLALPKVFPHSDGMLLVAAAAGALALCLSGLLMARLLALLLKREDQDRLALKFALSMKHTGLALGLASTVLADHPDAILLIILATPLQHLVAGVISRSYGIGS